MFRRSWWATRPSLVAAALALLGKLKETDQAAALGAFGPVCVLYLKGAAGLVAAQDRWLAARRYYQRVRNG